MIWRFRNRAIDLSSRGIVIGILNITPDSFSDGGQFFNCEVACNHGLHLLSEGASILDIGGESTRPGAQSITAEEEIRRTIPVIVALRKQTDAPISIDTSKALVALAAIEAGADIINDVTALSGDMDMIDVATSTDAGIVLMHMQGRPSNMQNYPSYPQDDVVTAVVQVLSEQRDLALKRGVDYESIVLDPGLGFGKTIAHNLSLLRNLSRLSQLGAPLMIGHSRKSFISRLADETSSEMTIYAKDMEKIITLLARQFGARLFRVHEPRPHAEAIRAIEALMAL